MKNVYEVLVVLSFTLALAYSERSPAISYITPTVVKNIGQKAEMTCTVTYASEFNVLWEKIDEKKLNEPVIYSSGMTLVVRDQRISLRQNTDENSYTLEINDIQETDASIYRCVVVLNIYHKIFAETNLILNRQPFILDNSTRSIIVKEGQLVKLECYAGGFPSPRVSWKRANNAILSIGASMYRGNILTIPVIKKEDRGTYYCFAENGVGRGARRNIAIEVEFAPVVTVSSNEFGQALHYDMNIVCRIESYPSPAIIWLNNGVQLLSNQHYAVTHSSTADEVTETTLQIITIEKRQYGSYICKASNVLGASEVAVTLYETALPTCPPVCDDDLL